MTASPAAPPVSEPAALRIVGFVKEYRGGVRAVDGLDLEVRPGEVFALLGPNGAGKSTTIRTVATLLAPTAGAVEVFGHDVSRDPDGARRLIGYVPQEMAFDRYLSARQHLELSAALHRIPRREARDRIAALLDLVELRDRADDLVKRFSGGMKKRLDIACGLLHRPRLLILDEPTQGLDIQTRLRIWRFVADLPGQGTTVLLTTHDMEEADELADRIAIVDHGRLQALGTPAELKAAYGGEMVKVELGRTRLSEAQRAELAALPGVRAVEERGRALLLVAEVAREVAPRVAEVLERQLGAPPGALSFGPPSLDDVFLKLTGHAIRDEP